MKRIRLSAQRGLSLVTIMVAGVVLAIAGLLAVQVVPTVTEYYTILRMVNKAKAGNNVSEVRAIFDKQAVIEGINNFDSKELDITKVDEDIVVAFAYEREIHLVGPGWLVLRYNGRSK